MDDERVMEKLSVENLKLFYDLFPVHLSSHTLNTQKCVEYALELASYVSMMTESETLTGSVYIQLSQLFSEMGVDTQPSDKTRMVLSRLVSDMYSNIVSEESFPKLIGLLERKMTKMTTYGIPNIRFKKNPLGINPSLTYIPRKN